MLFHDFPDDDDTSALSIYKPWSFLKQLHREILKTKINAVLFPFQKGSVVLGLAYNKLSEFFSNYSANSQRGNKTRYAC